MMNNQGKKKSPEKVTLGVVWMESSKQGTEAHTEERA